MIVKVRPGKLRQTRLHELALRFGFGGICTVLAGLIAKRFGPVAGGLFLAFPAIFPASASLIESHEKQRKERAGMRGERLGRRLAGVDAAGAGVGCVGLAVFAAIVWRELPRHSAPVIIAAATAGWAVVSIAGWWLWRRQTLVRLHRH